MNPFRLYSLKKLIFTNQLTLIPIGFNCSIADYLRDQNIRELAYPFDWVIVSFKDANKLIESGFKDFMEEANLIYNPTSFRQYFDENGAVLEKRDQVITPVLCKKYNMLFPHDFGEKAEEEFETVKTKYQIRIERLKEKILNKQNIILVYNVDNLNPWQIEQYNMAKLEIPEITYREVHRKYRISDIKYLNFEELRILVDNRSMLMFIMKIAKYRIKIRTKALFSK